MGEIAYQGYDASDEACAVCEQCIGALQELAFQQTLDPLPYVEPPANSRLWRYLDLGKYISLLDTSALFFCRADKFFDKFEGAKGLASRKEEWMEYHRKWLKQFVLTTRLLGVTDLNVADPVSIAKTTEKLLQEISESISNSRRCTFINCWHENEHESEAMWEIYSRRNEYMIAITTTYERLLRALDENPSISIGRVNYVDFAKCLVGVNQAFWCKKVSFSHEKEVRALLIDSDCFETDGVLRSVLLHDLIENVVLGPKSPVWFEDLVRTINQRFGHEFAVRQSVRLKNSWVKKDMILGNIWLCVKATMLLG